MNKNNKITIKYFGEGVSSLEAEESEIESKDILDVACELAFDTVGYGLAHWDFVERSFSNNILSEVYRYTLEDDNYYQLRFTKTIDQNKKK